LDGRLDKPFWERGTWIEDFFAIDAGRDAPRPNKRTRVKLRWDDRYLYIGAWLEENEIWAYVTDKNQPVYLDNAIEFFFVSDPALHHYIEFEINAKNVVWDLFLSKAYRDAEPSSSGALFAWDMSDAMSAVWIEGELNNPAAAAQKNRFWSAEFKIPWYALQCTDPGKSYPDHYGPQPGDIWRANFMRVAYRTETRGSRYEKARKAGSGELCPPSYWTWAPTGHVNIHIPEMWGYVLFADRTDAVFAMPPDTEVRTRLYRLYYAERAYGAKHGHYTDSVKELGAESGTAPGGLGAAPGAAADGDLALGEPKIYVTPNLFEIVLRGASGEWHIRQDAYLWKTDGV
jgi:hypothetical protein